jgi:cytochrome P450
MAAISSERGSPVLDWFDPLSPEYLADPYSVLAQLPSAEAPVFFAPSIGYYVVTRYADIEQVFGDPATYSAAVAQAPLVPLTEDPRRWSAVVQRPELIPDAVEETLRYDPSVPAWRRVTTRPAMLGDVQLPEGARLFLWLAAAGRDPAVFPDPDRFDLHRPNAAQHLAFGKGLHYCLGANLGKLEAQIAIAHLARRYPALRLTPGQQLSFHPNISFRGPQTLKVRTGP